MNRIKDVTCTLEKIAPTRFAESWDNVGLLAGDPDAPVTRALLTIDMTRPVLDEAKVANAQLIVAYHPPLFQPIKTITPGPGIPGLLYELVRHGLAVYSPHTALDVARDGVNDLLARIVGLESPQPLGPPEPPYSHSVKLVVYVPRADLESVAEALFAAGAGKIAPDSNYTKCSFRTSGTGAFLPGENANPAIGAPGRCEEVEEFRLETVVPKHCLGAVVTAMKTAHPYEEPAYDIFPMIACEDNLGLGRVGNLPEPTPLPDLLARIRKALNIQPLGLIGPTDRAIHRVAVAAGACGSLRQHVIQQQCDLFLTGELSHHHALELAHANVTTVLTGHSSSERPFLPLLRQCLQTAHPDLDILISQEDRDPIRWSLES